MKLGVAIGNFGQFGKRGGARDLVRIAEAAERLGYDSVWVHDHLVMPADIRARYPYNESGVAGFAWRQDIYDPLAMMAAVAAATERVEIGTSVLIVPYRNPIVLAKMLATLDQISNGRIRLGIGVGWMREEFEALGIGDWYEHRGSITDEWIAVCRTLWSGEGPSSYKGRFVRFEQVGAYPKPAPGGIPILVGGWGDAAARRVARIGDGYQTISSTPEMLAEQLERVDRELRRRERSRAEIEISMLGGIRLGSAAGAPFPALIGGDTQHIVARLREYAAAGLQHLIGTPNRVEAGPPTPDRLIDNMARLADEVLPLAHAL